MMRRAVLPLMLGASLVSTCAAPNRAVPPTAASRLLGQPLPSFRRPTITGSNFDTASAAGRIVVVDFFAAYCKPCRKSLPHLARLNLDRPDITIIGISLDDDPTSAALQSRRHGMAFPVIHDAGHALAGRFRVTQLPASFVADRHGKIRWVGGPGHPPDAVSRVVAELTRQNKAAPETAE